MTKIELITNIAMKSGLTTDQVETVINSFINVTTSAVKADKKMNLLGFGTFKALTPKPRIRVNKQTGEEEVIDPKTYVEFYPCKELKDLHNAPVKKLKRRRSTRMGCSHAVC